MLELLGYIVLSLLNKSGFAVTILEARDRVGGRTYSVDGVDLGGSWVSTQQPHVYQLCQDLGLELIPQYDHGMVVLSMNNVRTVHDKGVSAAIGGVVIAKLQSISRFLINGRWN